MYFFARYFPKEVDPPETLNPKPLNAKKQGALTDLNSDNLPSKTPHLKEEHGRTSNQKAKSTNLARNHKSVDPYRKVGVLAQVETPVATQEGIAHFRLPRV